MFLVFSVGVVVVAVAFLLFLRVSALWMSFEVRMFYFEGLDIIL